MSTDFSGTRSAPFLQLLPFGTLGGGTPCKVLSSAPLCTMRSRKQNCGISYVHPARSVQLDMFFHEKSAPSHPPHGYFTPLRKA